MEVTIEKFNPWKNSLIGGIFLLVFGILLAVFQQESLKWILIFAGVLAAVMGVLSLYDGVRSNFTPTIVIGAIELVIGIALIVAPNFFSDILMILLALALIIVGIVSVFNIGSGFAVANGSKVLSVVIGVVMIILGIYALLNLRDTADVVMIIIGVITAVVGLLNIYEAYQFKRIA